MSVNDAIYINLGQMVFNKLCELLKDMEGMNMLDTNQIDEMIIKKIFYQYKQTQKQSHKRKKFNKYTQTEGRGSVLKNKIIVDQANYKYSCKKCSLKFKSSYYLQKHHLYDGNIRVQRLGLDNRGKGK
ncbi:hypothetical protein pb186bvf_020470 [Paramecium bursaria]